MTQLLKSIQEKWARWYLKLSITALHSSFFWIVLGIGPSQMIIFRLCILSMALSGNAVLSVSVLVIEGPDGVGRHQSITLWELGGRTSPCSSVTKTPTAILKGDPKAPEFKFHRHQSNTLWAVSQFLFRVPPIWNELSVLLDLLDLEPWNFDNNDSEQRAN